jgi:hypothetical protein
MPVHDPTQALRTDPLQNLLNILLHQFKRLLVERGVEFTETEQRAIAEAVACKSDDYAEKREQFRIALEDIIEESLTLLKSWNLTFAQSLKTNMDTIPGWETTAEFLEIASEKSNAELRIAAGSALIVALGDLRYATYLLDVIEHDPNIEDVDAVFAMRVLLFVSSVYGEENDWLEQVKAWLQRSALSS